MRSEYDRDGLMKAQLLEQLRDVDNFQKNFKKQNKVLSSDQ